MRSVLHERGRLTIVKQVIERHGGKAWAASQPGRGATFFLTLS